MADKAELHVLFGETTFPQAGEEHDGGGQQPLDQQQHEGEHHGPGLTVIGRLGVCGGPGGVAAEDDDGALQWGNI